MNCGHRIIARDKCVKCGKPAREIIAEDVNR